MAQRPAKMQRPKFPKPWELGRVFSVRDQRDRAQAVTAKRAYSEFAIYRSPWWSKKARRQFAERFLERLQAKNELVRILREARHNSARIEIKDVEELRQAFQSEKFKQGLLKSVVYEGDLIPMEQVGQLFEGGGYHGLTAMQQALRELVEDRFVIDVPHNLLGASAEARRKYYILSPNGTSANPYPVFDAPGLVRLVERMKAADLHVQRTQEQRRLRRIGKVTGSQETQRTYDVGGRRKRPPKKRN